MMYSNDFAISIINEAGSILENQMGTKFSYLIIPNTKLN